MAFDTAAPSQLPRRASTVRGERRRDALLEAAAALLAEGGLDAVSHRAVAARASLPLAATTYYFSSREDLIGQALDRLAESQLAAAQAIARAASAGRSSPSLLARTIVSIVAGCEDHVDRGRLLTFYERHLQAGRHAALAPRVRAWRAEIVELVRDVLRGLGGAFEPDLPRVLVALVDGLLLDLLLEGRDDVLDAASVGVELVLRTLACAESSAGHAR